MKSADIRNQIPRPKEISSLSSNVGEMEVRQEMIDELDEQHVLFALEAPAHAAALWTIGQIEAFYESEGELLGPGLQVTRYINPLYQFSIDQSVALHCTFSLQLFLIKCCGIRSSKSCLAHELQHRTETSLSLRWLRLIMRKNQLCASAV